MVTCDHIREALSARIDGEDAAVADVVIARHLVECASCRAWDKTALAATRVARIRPAEAVPDLTAPILAAISCEPRPGVESGSGWAWGLASAAGLSVRRRAAT